MLLLTQMTMLSQPHALDTFRIAANKIHPWVRPHEDTVLVCQQKALFLTRRI